MCSECLRSSSSSSSAQALDSSAPARSLLAQTPATTAIIAINCAVLLAMAAIAGVSALSEPSSELLLRWGADYGPLTLSHQPWRAFTEMWLHVGIIHLLLNMWCLNVYGRITEKLFGWRFYLLMYVFAGLCGSLASLAWRPDRVSVGASGAIFGIAGALVMPYRRGDLGIDATVLKKSSKSLLSFIGYNLFIGAVVPAIDNMAHLGGLLGGFAMGFLWSRYRHSLNMPMLRRIAVASAAFVVVAYGGIRYVHRWSLLADEADVTYEQGRTEEAIAKAKLAVEHRPSDPYAHAVLGYAYLWHKDTQLGINELETAVRLQPNYEPVLARLGDGYIQSERFDDARQVLERAVALDKHDAEARLDLGVVYQNLHRASDSLTQIEEALRLNPKLARAHYMLGLTREDNHQNDLALVSFQEAVNLEPDNSTYAAHLAELYEAQGLHKEAQQVRVNAKLTDKP